MLFQFQSIAVADSWEPSIKTIGWLFLNITKRAATIGVEEHELNRTIPQQAAAHIIYHLLYAIHQYGYGPFLGLIDGQTVTPTFLIFSFGQF